MTGRTEDSTTYAQAYDAENRLSTVTVSGQTTTYSYDADGALVKKVQGGQTTVYVGQHFEKNLTTGQATSYYFLGGQRVALKKAGTLSYLLTDHLGSTSVTYNPANGQSVTQLYKPWGEPRWPNPSTLPTDYRFTGQRSEEATLGSLYDYGARAYSPRLGRFLSADTIVPQPGDPQSLNRYSYTRNSPTKLVDPTGHAAQVPDDGGLPDPLTEAQRQLAAKYAALFGIPYELVAATIAVEIVDDTDWTDPLLDFTLQTFPLALHYNLPGANPTRLLADAWLSGYEHYFGLLGSRGPGNGVANVHMQTAKDTEQYFAEH